MMDRSATVSLCTRIEAHWRIKLKGADIDAYADVLHTVSIDEARDALNRQKLNEQPPTPQGLAAIIRSLRFTQPDPERCDQCDNSGCVAINDPNSRSRQAVAACRCKHGIDRPLPRYDPETMTLAAEEVPGPTLALVKP